MCPGVSKTTYSSRTYTGRFGAKSPTRLQHQLRSNSFPNLTLDSLTSPPDIPSITDPQQQHNLHMFHNNSHNRICTLVLDLPVPAEPAVVPLRDPDAAGSNVHRGNSSWSPAALARDTMQHVVRDCCVPTLPI